MAIAAALQRKKPDIQILFVGTSSGIENQIIPELGYKLELLPSRPLERRLSLKLFGFIYAVVKGFFMSLNLTRKFSPDVVLGMGGYASFSPLIAAFILRKPRLLHEQNIIPGLANRTLSRVASKIAVSDNQSLRYIKAKSKTVITGNPVRYEYTAIEDRTVVAELLNLSANKKTLLAFGGSQGAATINNAIVELYSLFKDKVIQIIHIAGKRDYESIREKMESVRKIEDTAAYLLFDYYANMNMLYAISDLAICRAGANTIAELTAQGVPAIYIPYPFASDDHQTANARAVQSTGAGVIIVDSNLNGTTLQKEVDKLLFDEIILNNMKKASLEYGKPEAADEISKLIIDMAEKRI